MKTISDYTIYCTPEQTKKALELGAPITYHNNAYVNESVPHYFVGEYGNHVDGWILYFIPTAEQMIGLLEGLGLKFRVYQTIVTWTYMVGVKEPDDIRWEEGLDSRKEATLAAIDAALEYLNKNK